MKPKRRDVLLVSGGIGLVLGVVMALITSTPWIKYVPIFVGVASYIALALGLVTGGFFGIASGLVVTMTLLGVALGLIYHDIHTRYDPKTAVIYVAGIVIAILIANMVGLLRLR